jgi:hypothetical protein
MQEIKTLSPGLIVVTAAPTESTAPDTFVTENSAGFAGGHVAFENMKVGAANSRFRNPDDGVAGSGNFRLWMIEPCLLTRALIQECFHWIASMVAVE